jgi:Na+/H+ antiporter NhaD/arsenite permease-like protein
MIEVAFFPESGEVISFLGGILFWLLFPSFPALFEQKLKPKNTKGKNKKERIKANNNFVLSFFVPIFVHLPCFLFFCFKISPSPIKFNDKKRNHDFNYGA